jgi:hypothetical protein
LTLAHCSIVRFTAAHCATHVYLEVQFEHLVCVMHAALLCVPVQVERSRYIYIDAADATDDMRMYMMPMEIVHYNRHTAELGEVICERAKDLSVAAFIMARCGAVGNS